MELSLLGEKLLISGHSFLDILSFQALRETALPVLVAVR
jgi:hypothetical protein